MAQSPDPIEIAVLKVLSTRGPVPEDRVGFNYVTGGLVDSLGIIHLVTELEDELDVELLEEDFMAEGFRTFDGLVKVLKSAKDRADK